MWRVRNLRGSLVVLGVLLASTMIIEVRIDVRVLPVFEFLGFVAM